MNSAQDQGHLCESTGATKTDFAKLSDFICQADISL